MSVTVTENSNTAHVSESISTLEISGGVPSVTVNETKLGVQVSQIANQATILEVGHTVEVSTGGTAIVEIQTQGPMGEPAFRETGPAFTYQGGTVVRVDYDSGNYKLLEYVNEQLSVVDYVKNGETLRKSFIYNQDGTLAEVVESTI
jgi:hypothetical protein